MAFGPRFSNGVQYEDTQLQVLAKLITQTANLQSLRAKQKHRTVPVAEWKMLFYTHSILY